MLYFIVNEKSKSGNAKQIWKEIEEVLKVRNVSYQAFVSEYRGHAGKLAAEICAMDDNDICLVAVGGDGTANEVINGITDFEKVRFGVIPTGSGNDLARGLLLSKDPKNGAIHILNAMKKSREDTWCMDLGEVNFGEEKRLFAISAGIGLDALVCKKALKSTIKDILNKIRLGKLTYAATGVITAARLPQNSAPSSATSAKPNNIPNVATTFSFAIRPLIAATAIFQPLPLCVHPSGVKIQPIAEPIFARIHSAWAASRAAPSSPSKLNIPKPASVHPKFIKNHKMMVDNVMIVPAFLMKDQPRSHILLNTLPTVGQ